MSYISKSGKKPFERASKAAHGYVINDEYVKEFLSKCTLPKTDNEIEKSDLLIHSYSLSDDTPIKYVVSIDGGYTEVSIREDFPSSTFSFFQFGALMFELKDLLEIDGQPFIDPIQMSNLRQIQRFKLPLPTKNVAFKNNTLTVSLRKAIYEFFMNTPQNESLKLIDTLAWLIFREFDKKIDFWQLAQCPNPECKASSIPLKYSAMINYTFKCEKCSEDIYLTDVFRLHEGVDDISGASGILSYVCTSFEQIIIAHVIHLILKTNPNLMKQFIFIKDGPLAFFGFTANLFKPMRDLVDYLFRKHDLFMLGIEKSGAFVEHAYQISKIIPKGSFIIMDNNYIYKYVIPGNADPSNPYGRTTYYSNKLIVKTHAGNIHVISV